MGAAAASAWHSRGRRGLKLLGLGWGIGGGVSPYPPRRDVTVRLSLRRPTTSVSGYLSKFAQVSRDPGARRCPRPPHRVRASARPEPRVSACSPGPPPRRCSSAFSPRGPAGCRLLLLRTSSLLQSGARSAPSFSQTSGSQFESDRCPEAKNWASSFWKPSCAESEAPTLLHPRPACSRPLQPAQSRPASPRVRRRPPGKERRVTPGSRAGG